MTLRYSSSWSPCLILLLWRQQCLMHNEAAIVHLSQKWWIYKSWRNRQNCQAHIMSIQGQKLPSEARIFIWWHFLFRKNFRMWYTNYGIRYLSCWPQSFSKLYDQISFGAALMLLFPSGKRELSFLYKKTKKDLLPYYTALHCCWWQKYEVFSVLCSFRLEVPSEWTVCLRAGLSEHFIVKTPGKKLWWM